jgi:hypothetical protein
MKYVFVFSLDFSDFFQKNAMIMLNRHFPITGPLLSADMADGCLNSQQCTMGKYTVFAPDKKFLFKILPPQIFTRERSSKGLLFTLLLLLLLLL